MLFSVLSRLSGPKKNKEIKTKGKGKERKGRPGIMSEKVFCESGDAVRLPREKGADSREVWGTSPESGRLLQRFLKDSNPCRQNPMDFESISLAPRTRGTSGLLLSSTVRELQGSRQKNPSREVRGTSGEVQKVFSSSGAPGKSTVTLEIPGQISLRNTYTKVTLKIVIGF